MTPPAATAAARAAVAGAPARSRRRASAAAPAHAPARRAPGPRFPRRVSGAAPAPKRAPRPSLPAPRPKDLQGLPSTDRPLARRLVDVVASLPDLAIVDRALRGRRWIGVLGVMLFGLVAVQVGLLKLNAGIGSAVERTAALERSNGELRAQVSKLSSGERIQRKAGQIGMVLPPAGKINFVRPGRGDAAAAAAALQQGRFGSEQQTAAGAGLAVDGGTDDGAGAPDGSQDPGGAATAGADVDPLNDGDPGNDHLHDGDPGNDVDVENDGDPSNDAAASDPLNDGDPSNDHLHDGDPSND